MAKCTYRLDQFASTTWAVFLAVGRPERQLKCIEAYADYLKANLMTKLSEDCEVEEG